MSSLVFLWRVDGVFLVYKLLLLPSEAIRDAWSDRCSRYSVGPRSSLGLGQRDSVESLIGLDTNISTKKSSNFLSGNSH